MVQLYSDKIRDTPKFYPLTYLRFTTFYDFWHKISPRLICEINLYSSICSYYICYFATNWYIMYIHLKLSV